MKNKTPKLSLLTTYCQEQYTRKRPTLKVRWSKKVNRQLEGIPSYLREKFIAWVMVVERIGLRESRKIAGYHDEPLKGHRKGQRSIRLNLDYRAIYFESTEDSLLIVEVIEINKHEY